MPDLHPLLAGRWSPRAFDPGATVTGEELSALLEAARWAPSADNSQPWRFVIGRRDDESYKRILTTLGPDEQRWAWRAPVLLAGAYATGTDDGVPLPYAPYDLGQAVAHLSLQAAALDLYVHQMVHFDAVGLHRELCLPDDVAVHVVAAVGRLGDPHTLPPDLRERELELRHRRPLTDLLLAEPVHWAGDRSAGFA